MTGKRLVIIIGGVVAGLALLVALFVGVISGIILYSVSRSDAAETARAYLRSNQKLRRDIGEVRGFGWLVRGSLNGRNTDGDATIELKVQGERRTVNAQVVLAYRRGSKWWVTDASYLDEHGAKVDLMEKYEPPPQEHAPGEP